MAIKVVNYYDSVDEFEFWGGAKHRMDDLSAKQKEAVWDVLEGMLSHEDEVTDTTINDIVWFDDYLWEAAFNAPLWVVEKYYQGEVSFSDVSDDIANELLDKVKTYASNNKETLTEELLTEYLSQEYNGLEMWVTYRNEAEDEDFFLDVVVMVTDDDEIHINGDGATFDEMFADLEVVL